MNVTPPPAGSPADPRSRPHPTCAVVPQAPAYRIIDARVPADPGLTQSTGPPESNLVLFCQTLLNLNEFLTIE